ncbi:MAG TPA: hypothetical protein VK867_08800, partial [Candidatus Limnocylindrales bacterium]|nr:hypothetical protein [Candidatus Limnocylindrales bacterium]
PAPVCSRSSLTAAAVISAIAVVLLFVCAARAAWRARGFGDAAGPRGCASGPAVRAAGRP